MPDRDFSTAEGIAMHPVDRTQMPITSALQISSCMGGTWAIVGEMSLKSIDKKVAKKRQVYKPVLDNPYTNEAHLWPRVDEQQFVWELLQTSILVKTANYAELPVEQWPWDLAVAYNEIVEFLESQSQEVFLFVCNKDAMVSSVLLGQIPLLCQMSDCQVTLVQLPKGSLQVLQRYLPALKEGLLLLQCNEKLGENFVAQIKSRVSELEFPWLDDVKYRATSVGLVKTTAPLGKARQKK